MKRLLTLFSLLIPFIASSQNQGINNWWNLGYGSVNGPQYHTTLNFINGSPVIGSDSIEMDFDRTAANISDTNGNLLFYTNGYYVADASDDTMQNGNGISPTGFITIEPYGLTVPQACLIIPKPGSNNFYYIFHSTIDNVPYYNKALKLYSSQVDMNLNGGLGGVINKNTVLINDTLNPGKITACKHGNGRDWWVIVQRVNSNLFYKFLLTDQGLIGPLTQNIGATRLWSGGMACFSPDGEKYAYFHAEYTTTGGLDIYDFDRCSGVLSNPIHITIPQSASFSGGCAFSANSRFLYTANIFDVYQFDMNATNIALSQITVATWDSFYSPSPPYATGFEIPQLAPDGKIYISTGNSTFHMHVINYPDSVGLACDVQQHALQFQYWYSNGIPNHPNYFLDCDTNSTCQCLTTGIHKQDDLQINIVATPNPNSGIFTLQFPVQSFAGQLELYDVMGNLVLKDYVAPWSQFKKIDITTLPDGIYLCKLKWKDTEGTIKIVKSN